jgi:predicted MFS family arabinose efflux permease
VRLVRRLIRLVWGTEVDPALRPVLAVGLAGTIAGSTVYPFLGVWALTELGASQIELSIALLAGALCGGAVGFLGGSLSDRVGRRPVILASWTLQIAVAPMLVLAGHRVALGLAVLALFPALGSLGNAADQALVADLVPPERHEQAYAAVRVANNLGIALGPPIGALLLIGQNWTRLFLGATAMACVGLYIAWRWIPAGGRYRAEPSERPRGAFGVIRHDAVFLVFLASSVLATMTYVAFETLLPISLVASHGLQPSEWGFLLVINPILVTLVQLRLTRATTGIRASTKLAVALPLMGAPFLLLTLSGTVPTAAVVILLFVFGEMLWIPTSQAVVAAIAPADIRGAYMGVFGASWAVAWALAPFGGLQVRNAFGDDTMWACVAVISLAAGVAGALAARGHDADVEPVGQPA